MKVARFLRRFVVALVCLVVAGGTVVTAQVEDVEAAIDWIYYKDASGRELAYDFSSGTIENSRTITIPSGAVTLPASEAGGVLTWERADGLSDIWLDNNWYYMSIPQALPSVIDIPTADIVVDGSIGDWSGVDVYADDIAGDIDPSFPTGSDIDYVKLAYSSDSTTLYILYKLTEDANQNVWYRLFLDKNLDGGTGEPGDYQIDVAYFGSWDVISQTWDSSDNWYDVPENGVASVSGQYIEAAVDCSAFGLPANMDVWGRTMEVAAPYDTYDRFSSHFQETEGSAYVYAAGTVAPTPTEWQCAARISHLSNPGFGDSVPYLNFAGPVLTGNDSDDLMPGIEALWVTGDFAGTELDDALLVMAFVEGYDDVNQVDYDWRWGPETGGGVVIDGLDPSTTVVDLNIEVTDDGQVASFYYRIDSDATEDWQLAISHVLPEGTGTLYGFPVNGVRVGLETGFMRTAPVYRFWSPRNRRHFYTTSRGEKNKLIDNWSHVWTYEQIAYYTFCEDGEPNVLPIHRFWSGSLKAHFYTITETEKDKLINQFSDVWTYEGPAFYAWAEGNQPDGAEAVYRFWSNTLKCHFYTMNTTERDKLINQYSDVWTYEGIAWYAYREQMVQEEE